MIINLTPHSIVIRLSDDSESIYTRTVEMSDVPRVVFDHTEGPAIEGAPSVIRGAVPRVVGLPDPRPGVLYAVSTMVFDALPERLDLIVPDSGPGSVIRDTCGQIVACRRWVTRG